MTTIKSKKVPFFSIIIPVFNVEPFLEKCIDSCLSQTFKDYEIILIDDGSTDSSKAICDEYGNRFDFIKVVHKTNGGLVSSRKTGANCAIGQYAICLDADDWLDNDYLYLFHSVIAEYNPDIVCCGFFYAFDDKLIRKPFSSCAGFLRKEEITKKIYPSLIQNEKGEYFPPSVWAKAFKMDLYKKSQMLVNNSIRIGEDCACVIPAIYRAKTIFCMPDCLYYYRQNKLSMTRGKRVFDFSGPKLLYEHLSSVIDLKEYDFSEQAYRKVVHELFLVVVSQFYKKEKFKTICSSIDKKMNDELFLRSLKGARFKKSVFARLMHWSLVKRHYSLLKAYSTIKTIH